MADKDAAKDAKVVVDDDDDIRRKLNKILVDVLGSVRAWLKITPEVCKY